MSLRLLHISDIHFSVDGWDEDADQRNELLRDLASLVEGEGPIDGVLVGGDIAFSAKPAEYEVAREWIDQVLAVCGGLDRSRVWTVPGNHDVDRELVRTSADALRFRLDLATCELAGVDYHLRQRLSVSADASALMAPFESYNDFAMGYGCAVRAEEPRWFDERTLVLDGWRVRLLGISSVLTSGAGNEKGNLVVGCHQARIERREGVIDIVMMHHPPRWLRDWPHIEPYLKRAHVWVFGHEHAYAAKQHEPNGSVEISAGAVAPERDFRGEQDPYVAAYNVLTLSRREGDRLEVEIHPRYWDLSTTQFKLHPDGRNQFTVSQQTPGPGVLHEDHTNTSEHDSAAEPEVVSAVPLAQDLVDAEPAPTAREVVEMQDLRRIGVEYLSLPAYRRHAIAKSLQVLEPEDSSARPAELYPTILRRVRDRNLIDQLKEELAK